MDDTTPVTSLTLDRHLAIAGPAAMSLAELWSRLWRQRYIPAELLELCRLSFARMHRDESEQTAGNPHVPPGRLSGARREAALHGIADDDASFSPAEHAVLAFAEQYWLDARSITDDAAANVIAHFGEPALVFLIEALGCIDGRIRVARCVRGLADAVSAEVRRDVH